MKKRCTNSACRKVFRRDSVCPFCGKEYPRLLDVQPNTVSVILVNNGNNRIVTCKVLCKLNVKLSLTEARQKVFGSFPCVIGEGLSRQEAIKWCEELNKTGALAKVQ